MNIKTLGNSALEQALGAKLKELLSGIAWLRQWQVERVSEKPDAGFDLLATLPLPEGKATLCVVCKKELRPSAFPALAEKRLSPPGRPRVIVPVLAMPFGPASPTSAFREAGVGTILRETVKLTCRMQSTSNVMAMLPCIPGLDPPRI